MVEKLKDNVYRFSAPNGSVTVSWSETTTTISPSDLDIDSGYKITEIVTDITTPVPEVQNYEEGESFTLTFVPVFIEEI